MTMKRSIENPWRHHLAKESPPVLGRGNTTLTGVAMTFLALACAAATSLRAATITVMNTADSGAGSLRQALAGAADGDTIDAAGVSGTILLTSGELVVSNSVTILGPGPANLAVDGNAAS